MEGKVIIEPCSPLFLVLSVKNLNFFDTEDSNVYFCSTLKSRLF